MYTVKYTFDIITDGCDCCQYTEHSLIVYDECGEEEWSMTYPDRCFDDEDVVKFMKDYLPEFPDFRVSPDSTY